MSEARLVLTLPGGRRQEFTLARATVAIGRAPTNEIVLRDAAVSRSHARLERLADGGYEVVDAHSANGVSVNGVKRERARLIPGDVFVVGNSTFELAGPQPDAELAPTRIDTERDLQQTILSVPVPVHLGESAVPRVAVYTANGTWEVVMEGDSLTIGRDPSNDVRLEFPSVSRHHAVIERAGADFRVRDLQSQNGTWIGGERVSQAVLGHAACVLIAPAQMVFKHGAADGALAREGMARRPVVVIPGFGGSNLWRGSEQVWPTLRLFGHSDLLRMEQPLDVRGVVDEVVVVPNLIQLDQYSQLTDYLKESLEYESGRDLLEFAYDFRQDNRDSAHRLAAAIDEPPTPSRA